MQKGYGIPIYNRKITTLIKSYIAIDGKATKNKTKGYY